MAEVAAVAVKAEEGGEDEVLVCLVLRPGVEPPKLEDIFDFCVARMPYFNEMHPNNPLLIVLAPPIVKDHL